jgi:hypothetical protein
MRSFDGFQESIGPYIARQALWSAILGRLNEQARLLDDSGLVQPRAHKQSAPLDIEANLFDHLGTYGII